MQIQGLQQASSLPPVNRPASAKNASGVEQAASINTPRGDELELSAKAQEIIASQATNSTSISDGIRTEKVAALRQAIADGTYETSDKLSGALDRLLDTFA